MRCENPALAAVRSPTEAHPQDTLLLISPRPRAHRCLRAALYMMAVVALALAPTEASAQPFDNATEALGVVEPPLPYEIHSMNAGVSYVDVDGDGLRDIFYTGPHRPGATWRRNGSGFEFVEGVLGVTLDKAMGHTFFDMDGDGDLDLLVLTDGPNRLFENTADGLVDVTEARLPGIETWSLSAAAGDYDGDGDVDLYVANYVHANAFPDHVCAPNSLLENDGHGYFAPVASALGVAGRGCSFVTSMADVDDDGDLDLLAVNDFGQFTDPNELYINVGRGPDGRPQFEAAASETGFDRRHYGMGLALGDLDDDGTLDAAMTNIGEALLLSRQHDGRWRDDSRMRGLDAVSHGYEGYQVTWAATFHDVNADGALDLALAGGFLVAAGFIKNVENQPQVLLLGGDPSGVLHEVAPEDRYGTDDRPGRDIEFADIDNDGRDDVLLANNDGTVGIYLNRRLTGGKATTLRLRPTMTAGGAAGARITAQCGGHTRSVAVNVGRMYGTADVGEVSLTMPPPCVQSGESLALRVRWPSGIETEHDALTGTDVTLVEPTWLVGGLDDGGGIVVDFSETVTQATEVALELPSGSKAPLMAQPAQRFELAAAPDASWVSVLVDGTRLPIVVRRAEPQPTLRRYPTHVVAGSKTTWTVTPTAADGSPVGPGHGVFVEVDGKVQPTQDLGDGSYRATSTVPAMLQGSSVVSTATWVNGQRQATGTHPLTSRFDPAWSRVEFARLFHVGFGIESTATARVRYYASDSNGRLTLPTLNDVELGVDGYWLAPDELVERTANARFHFPLWRIPDGAKVRPYLYGAPVAGTSDRARRFIAAEDAVASVSPTRSRCTLSEHRGVADGVDQITAIIFVTSPGGTGIPLDDIDIGFSDDGLRPVEGSLDPSTGVVEVTLTVDPSARSWASTRLLLDGVDVGIACSVAVAPPRPAPRVDAHKSEIRLRYQGVAPLGTPLVVQVFPRGVDGRALGSRTSPEIELANAELVAPLHYIGHGRFQATIVATDSVNPPVVTVVHRGGAEVRYSAELSSVLATRGSITPSSHGALSRGWSPHASALVDARAPGRLLPPHAADRRWRASAAAAPSREASACSAHQSQVPLWLVLALSGLWLRQTRSRAKTEHQQ